MFWRTVVECHVRSTQTCSHWCRGVTFKLRFDGSGITTVSIVIVFVTISVGGSVVTSVSSNAMVSALPPLGFGWLFVVNPCWHWLIPNLEVTHSCSSAPEIVSYTPSVVPLRVQKNTLSSVTMMTMAIRSQLLMGRSAQSLILFVITILLLTLKTAVELDAAVVSDTVVRRTRWCASSDAVKK
jgi:hypothetical protein